MGNGIVYAVGSHIAVPGKDGIQGRIASRREETVHVVPAITVVDWIGSDGLAHSATFNDDDLDSVNAPRAKDSTAVASIRIERSGRKRKPARKTKRK